MSYTDQADRLNKTFGNVMAFNNMDAKEKKELIDAVLIFGQVAKFRCRSNTAYDNFAKQVFSGIVELERTKLEGHDFDVLQVKVEK